jgi:serine/threonine-protein kinase
MSHAVAEFHYKTRELAQRDALLLEARRELDQALKVGGPGRFTEQRLGSFELGVLLGRGAMSDIYEAVHVESRAPAAVKLLHRDVLSKPQYVRRFLREVRIAAALDLPNVVRVLEVGGDDAPIPYIAMERLRGVDLAQLLRAQRRLNARTVIEMLRQVARGVDGAHAAGVIHRDLKPQNLFQHELPDGSHEWKVLDFGVSRLLDDASSLTDGHAVGTPSYMSPEQARGRDVDRRADIFSLGVIAYRSLTGRPAFTGREIPHILHEVVFGMPPRPSETTRLPSAVDNVLAVALAKKPADRFETAAALVDALEEALLGVANAELAARADRLIDKIPWGRRSIVE